MGHVSWSCFIYLPPPPLKKMKLPDTQRVNGKKKNCLELSMYVTVLNKSHVYIDLIRIWLFVKFYGIDMHEDTK